MSENTRLCFEELARRMATSTMALEEFSDVWADMATYMDLDNIEEVQRYLFELVEQHKGGGIAMATNETFLNTLDGAEIDETTKKNPSNGLILPDGVIDEDDVIIFSARSAVEITPELEDAIRRFRDLFDWVNGGELSDMGTIMEAMWPRRTLVYGVGSCRTLKTDHVVNRLNAECKRMERTKRRYLQEQGSTKLVLIPKPE